MWLLRSKYSWISRLSWVWILRMAVLVIILPILLMCTTGAVSGDVNASLPVIRSAVLRCLPGGLRSQSQNGREYFSKYFPLYGKFTEDAESKNERAFAHILILGDRRPYNVEVRIVRERKERDVQGVTYSETGLDKNRSKELLKILKEELANRRDDRNLVDDFRAL